MPIILFILWFVQDLEKINTDQSSLDSFNLPCHMFEIEDIILGSSLDHFGVPVTTLIGLRIISYYSRCYITALIVVGIINVLLKKLIPRIQWNPNWRVVHGTDNLQTMLKQSAKKLSNACWETDWILIWPYFKKYSKNNLKLFNNGEIRRPSARRACWTITIPK